MAEQALRVVAGDGGLMHGGGAVGKHGGQQDGALHLGARHGKRVGNGAHPAAVDKQRSAARLGAAGFNPSAHLFQRLHDAAHGAGTQGGVPEHFRIKGAGSQHAGQQPHARAGIAAVDGPFRSRGLHGDARYAEADGAIPLPFFQHFHLGPQLLHGAQGIQAVFTAQEIIHFRHSLRQAAQDGGAVGNAFVSGYGQYPLQGRNGMGAKVHGRPEELPCIGR